MSGEIDAGLINWFEDLHLEESEDSANSSTESDSTLESSRTNSDSDLPEQPISRNKQKNNKDRIGAESKQEEQLIISEVNVKCSSNISSKRLPKVESVEDNWLTDDDPDIICVGKVKPLHTKLTEVDPDVQYVGMYKLMRINSEGYSQTLDDDPDIQYLGMFKPMFEEAIDRAS